MPDAPEFPLKVFYDGACSVCGTEVERYGRQDRAGRLTLVDISAPDFTPEEYGITLAEFMYELHVIDRQGKVYKGPEAFWAIWQTFPASTLYGLLGFLIALPGIRLLARLAYKGFARGRKYLPRRQPPVCKVGRGKPD
jgi:predicted DCC family thiol-disulfide oxidoreductase YuxK